VAGGRRRFRRTPRPRRRKILPIPGARAETCRAPRARRPPPRSILPSAPSRPEPHRMTRRILAPAVVLTWLVMVGWQVRREYFRTELARLGEAARALAPGVSFYTLTMGSRAVGQATSRLDTIPGGFVLDDRMSLELPALGQTGTAVVRTLVELDESLVMRSFDFTLDSEIGRFQAEGTLRPDTTLEVRVSSAGSVQDL